MKQASGLLTEPVPEEYNHRHGLCNAMGLSTPATKVWEIPEPKPAYAPEPKQREPEPEKVKAPEKEREKEPVPA
jgi:hypothetical protein